MTEQATAASILVVEDEPEIRRFVRATLLAERWRVREAGSVESAREALAAESPALMILDLGLPDGDGIQLVAELRAWSALPVLVLSARSEEADKVAALDAGADDYLTKPFGVRELNARVRALLRRPGAAEADSAVCMGDVVVDRARRTVMRGDVPLHLTPIEYRLLLAFIAHAGRVLTHRQLLREVWGPGHGTDAQYLRVYVGHLRQKLERDPTRPRHLLTETGIGYRFQL